MTMVDEEKRRTIRRLGIGAGIVIGGGAGAGKGLQWVVALDDDLDPGEVEDEIKVEIRARDWPVDTVFVSGIEAELEHIGRTEKGGDRYTATVTAPLRSDVDYRICEYADGGRPELELADTLREHAELLFDGLYDVAGRYTEPHRAPVEDRITEYAIRFEDATGAAEVAFDADQLYHINHKETEYVGQHARNRFIQAYGEAFDTRCDSNG